ncbi:MAG: SseB family protein [Rhodobacteraceae bacterium]|nr:SseB family protein [Paracoccaceae bacterium]
MADTPLDRAHAAMEAGGNAARLAFFQEIADAELFLLLEREANDGEIAPKVFPLDEGSFVLAFDREERLAAFAETPVPYAALPGRIIAGALAGQDVGLGLNLGVAPSSMLLPPEALGWLAGMLAAIPEETGARIAAVLPAHDIPATLCDALARKLSGLSGLAAKGWFARVRYADDSEGHLLAFEGAQPGAEAALAKAVSETLVFSGIETLALDVAFPAAGDPLLTRLATVARAIEIQAPPVREMAAPKQASAPGMDPTKPPILR